MMSAIQTEFLNAVKNFSRDVLSNSATLAASAHALYEATYDFSPPAGKFGPIDWACMYREVRPMVAQQGDDVVRAFRTVLTACKQFEEGAQAPEQPSQLRAAFEVIGRAYPQTVPARQQGFGGPSAPSL